MLRNQWKLRIKGSDLLPGVKEKITHTQNRITYWEAEVEKAQNETQDSFQLRPQEVTGGRQLVANFDQAAAARASQAEMKLGSHREKLESYQLWEKVFETQPETVFEVDSGDLSDLGYGWTAPPA